MDLDYSTSWFDSGTAPHADMLMLDTSHSMILYGETASPPPEGPLALTHLIRTSSW